MLSLPSLILLLIGLVHLVLDGPVGVGALLSSDSVALLGLTTAATSQHSVTLLGGLHTCVVTNTGGLGCIGYDQYGQATGAPGSVGWKKVCTGLVYSCALTSGGSVTCWGDLTVGGHGLIPSPQTSPLAADIICGADFMCSLGVSGLSLTCYGNNDYGALKAPNVSALVAAAPLGTSVSQIAAGWEHACLSLSSSGSIYCWGDNTYGQRNVPLALSGLVAGGLSAGRTHSCAADNTTSVVTCWGNTNYQQTPVATLTASTTPSPSFTPFYSFSVSPSAAVTPAVSPSSTPPVLAVQSYCYGAPMPYDANSGVPALQLDLRCPPSNIFGGITWAAYGVFDGCGNVRSSAVDALGAASPYMTQASVWTTSARCPNPVMKLGTLASLAACGAGLGGVAGGSYSVFSTSCNFVSLTLPPPPDPCAFNTQDTKILAVQYDCYALRGSATSTNSPSSTPTPSGGSSPSASMTGLPSQSRSPSTSSTPSLSSTSSTTPTPVPTMSGTMTSSPTLTGSGTMTPTRTQTGSGTASPSSTRTGTSTGTKSGTGSGTPSQTQTKTRSQTPSGSSSQTQTPSALATPSTTSSLTPTKTGTPSSSGSVSGTPSNTGSNSGTPSNSGSPSGTPSQTPSESGTPSNTASNTQSPSGTPTVTASSSGTPSNTVTPTVTPSQTSSATQSPSGTQTQTGTPSPSNVPLSCCCGHYSATDAGGVGVGLASASSIQNCDVPRTIIHLGTLGSTLSPGGDSCFYTPPAALQYERTGITVSTQSTNSCGSYPTAPFSLNLKVTAPTGGDLTLGNLYPPLDASFGATTEIYFSLTLDYADGGLASRSTSPVLLGPGNAASPLFLGVNATPASFGAWNSAPFLCPPITTVTAAGGTTTVAASGPTICAPSSDIAGFATTLRAFPSCFRGPLSLAEVGGPLINGAWSTGVTPAVTVPAAEDAFLTGVGWGSGVVGRGGISGTALSPTSLGLRNPTTGGQTYYFLMSLRGLPLDTASPSGSASVQSLSVSLTGLPAPPGTTYLPPFAPLPSPPRVAFPSAETCAAQDAPPSPPPPKNAFFAFLDHSYYGALNGLVILILCGSIVVLGGIITIIVCCRCRAAAPAGGGGSLKIGGSGRHLLGGGGGGSARRLLPQKPRASVFANVLNPIHAQKGGGALEIYEEERREKEREQAALAAAQAAVEAEAEAAAAALAALPPPPPSPTPPSSAPSAAPSS